MVSVAARLALFTYTEHTVHCILGYNDFNNLFLPGHLMAANFILRHIYKKKVLTFFSAVSYAFVFEVKKKLFFKTAIWVLKRTI
jgi:hypothetical protein